MAEHDPASRLIRTEVRCRRCGGRLGHVFNDSLTPTGLCHDASSVSLPFEMRERGGATSEP
jgi:peptide-methionine (R)-S-oxide reductase